MLSRCHSELLKEQFERLDLIEELYDLLEAAVAEDAPIGIKDGGIIKKGFHAEVDKLRNAHVSGKGWLA